MFFSNLKHYHIPRILVTDINMERGRGIVPTLFVITTFINKIRPNSFWKWWRRNVQRLWSCQRLTLMHPGGGVKSTLLFLKINLLKKYLSKPTPKHPCKIKIFYALWGQEKKIWKNLHHRYFSEGGKFGPPLNFEKIKKNFYKKGRFYIKKYHFTKILAVLCFWMLLF